MYCMSKRIIREMRYELIEKADDMYPNATSRELADVFGVSKSTIVRTLNDDG